MNFTPRSRSFGPNSGFTLVEVVVYAVLMGVFSVVIVLNLRESQTSLALERVSAVIISDFRRAQSLAILGLTFQGNAVCGYGIHQMGLDYYQIYAGGGTTCSSSNRNYQSGNDFVVQTIRIVDSNVRFRTFFNDIFFEPPDPKTYLNNSFSLSASPLVILVGLKGKSCPSGCKTITVFPSGKIDSN